MTELHDLESKLIDIQHKMVAEERRLIRCILAAEYFEAYRGLQKAGAPLSKRMDYLYWLKDYITNYGIGMKR